VPLEVEHAPDALEQPEPKPIGIPGATREEAVERLVVAAPRYAGGDQRLG
jgi:hypothetical protein